MGSRAARRAVAHLFPLRGKAELGDDPRRGRIVAEMPDREIGEAARLEGMQDERADGLGGIAHAPIRLADPITELGMVLAEGTVAGAADQRAGSRNGEHHPFLAGKDAGDPLGRLLLAVGVRNSARHARDVIVAGKQANTGRVCKERRAQ